MAGKKFARVQLLAIDGLLDNTQRAEHPDYEPDSIAALALIPFLVKEGRAAIRGECC